MASNFAVLLKINGDTAERKKQQEETEQSSIKDAVKEGILQYWSLLEESIPFKDEDPFYFHEDATIDRLSQEANVKVLEEIRGKLTAENYSDARIELELELLEFSTGIISSAHRSHNNAQRNEADTIMWDLVAELTVKFKQKLEQSYEETTAVSWSSNLPDFSSEAIAFTLALWKQAEKPGTKDFQKEYFFRLQKQLGVAIFKFKNKHKLHRPAPYQAQAGVDRYINSACGKFERKFQTLAENTEADKLDEIHEDMCNKVKGEFAQWENNPFPVGHGRHGEYLQKLEDRLRGIYVTVKENGVHREGKSAIKKSCCSAVEEGVQYYCQKMKEVLQSLDFLLDADLQTEHDSVFKEAAEKCHDLCQCGAPHHTQADLRQKIQLQFAVIRQKNETRRILAHQEASNVVDQGHAKYKEVLEPALDSQKTNDELKLLHKQTMEEAVQFVVQKCSEKRQAEFPRQYADMLTDKIEDTWDVLMDLFPMKRTQEEISLVSRWDNCQKMYRERMEKPCKAASFIDLDYSYHEKARNGIIEKLGADLPDAQKKRLEKKMDVLFMKYKKENEMKLNYAEDGTPAIGIHLGYKYCCIAVFFQGEVIFIPNRPQGNIEKTPCYVTYHPDGSKKFGKVAKLRGNQHPDSTLYDVKKILGKKMDDPELQRNMECWPFLVEEHDGLPTIDVDGRRLRPEEVLADMLTQVRGMMEECLMEMERGSTIEAVITVPTYFNEDQVRATREAGKMAGLEVLTIINEPSAAALAYSLDWFDKAARKVLVFDLGSETLDVAVVEVTPTSLDVLGVGRDAHVGGEDFDRELVEYCARWFQRRHRIDLMEGTNSLDLKRRAMARQSLIRLQAACEKAKKVLSFQFHVTVCVDALYDGRDLQVEITRALFEELTRPWFRNAIQIVEQALNHANVRRAFIQDIILVGGSTRIPKLQEMLSQYFGGKTLTNSVPPEKVLAYGAAVKAAMMNGERLIEENLTLK